MSEDGEAVEGLIPKIQAAFDKYTQGSVSVIDKQNGGLHSTYEILEQLSTVYPTLTDEAKAYLNEAIAGNRQNKVLVAIMENWSNVEASIKSATNSTGSAMKENEKYLNSIQGKLSQFSSATQLLWKNTIDSNLIKFIVDVGTGIVKLIDKFGLLNTAIMVVTASMLLFNKSFLAFYNANIASLFSGFAEVIQHKLITSLGMAKASAIGLAGAFNMIAPLAVITVIMLLVKGVQYLAEATERQREAVRKLKEEYDTLSSSLEENESKQQKVIDRLLELYDLRNNNSITKAEKEELTRLENVNTELKRQIEYEKALKAIKGEALEREALKLANKDRVRSEIQYDVSPSGNVAFKSLLIGDKMQEDIDIINDYTAQINELEKSFDNNQISVEDYGKKLEELKNLRSKQVEGLDELIVKLQEENESYNGATEEGNKKKITNEIIIKSAQDLIMSLNQEKSAIDALSGSTSDGANKLKTYTQSMSEFNEAINTAESSLKTLNKALEDNGSLTSEQVLDLLEKYPELINKIEKTTEGYRIQESALEDLRKQQIKTALDGIQAQFDEAKNVKTQTENKLKQYGLEIEKLKDIAKAKKELANLAHKEAMKYATASAGAEGNEILREKRYSRAYKSYIEQTGYADLSIYQEAIDELDELSKKKGVYEDLLNDKKLGLGSSSKSKSSYSPSTEQSALKDLLNANKISLQEYYDRLLILEKSQYSNYANKSAEQLEKLLRSQNKDIAKKTEEYLALNIERKNIKLNLDTIALDAVVVPLTNELDDLKFAFKNLTDEEFDEKLNNIAQQLSIQKDLASTYQTAISDLTNEYKNGNITQDQYDDKLKELQSSLKNANRATIELSNSTNDLTESQKSHAEKLASEIIKTQKEIDKATLDSFKTTSDAKIKSYQDKIDALEEQNDLIEEQKQKQEKILAIQEAQNKLFEIQNDRNTKILRQKEDGTYYWSMEANPQKIKDAQDNLKKVQEDYANWQRNVNLKKQKKYWQDLIQQEKDAQKEQEDLFNKHYANVEHLTTTYLDNLKTTYGDKWDEIIAVQEDKLKRLQDNYAKMVSIDTSKANYLSDSTISSGSNSNKSQSTSGLNPDKLEQMAKNSAEWHSADDKKKAELAAENLKIGTEMGLTRSGDGIWYDKNGKRVYDTGGILPYGGSAVNLSGKPERILSPEQTKNFDRLIKELPNLIKALDITKIVMPKINMPSIPAIAGNNNGLSNGTVYNIHVDKVVANDGKQFINTLTRMVHIQ